MAGIIGFAIIAIGLVAFVIVGCVESISAKRRLLNYVSGHPPISDEEFVRRLPPGTDPVVAITVRHIVADRASIPVELIYPDTRFDEIMD